MKMIHMMSKTKRFNMSTIVKIKEAILQISNNGDHKETGTTKATKEIGVVATTIIKVVGVIKVIKEIIKQIIEKNADSDAQLDSHNTSIRDLEETQEEVNPSRKNVTDMLEPVVPKAKSLSINVLLVEALEQMPGYAKVMKDLVTKKISMNCEMIKITHQVSSMVHSLDPKLEDPGAFTIPCTIGSANFAKDLCDVGASINLMPYSVFKTLGIGQPRPTSMRLQMADRTMKRPLGITDDVLVKVDKFILSADFVILDCEVDYEVPIIIGRPFLATGKALVDVESGELTFRVGDENVVFHVCKSMRQTKRNKVCSFVDIVTEVIVDDTSDVIYVGDTLEIVLLNHDEDEKEGFVECVNALQDSTNKALNRGASHLGVKAFAFTPHVDATLAVLQRRKKAIGWTLADIRGYNQILIALEDQEKTTFTCPYGTFCLDNLDKVLAHCEETSLVLNWEKCHFMVNEGIVLGHMISKNGIEVEKSRIEVISKLPPPISKDAKFFFIEYCMKPFELLKYKLTTTPIITAPNWILPFELLCDASNVADEPYLFKICTNGIIRRCVPEEEQLGILEACHSFPYGGHHGGERTATKVLRYGFYCPTLYKDASELIKHCDDCQRAGGIS
ncbi:uncharacterized protein [Nicotiana tomentosiformis]|uniref:uncharacterized protein n=1 Tax=Nicotiana tomentosiformis TaxID=4098 RepID=UPI00388C7C2D